MSKMWKEYLRMDAFIFSMKNICCGILRAIIHIHIYDSSLMHRVTIFYICMRAISEYHISYNKSIHLTRWSCKYSIGDSMLQVFNLFHWSRFLGIRCGTNQNKLWKSGNFFRNLFYLSLNYLWFSWKFALNLIHLRMILFVGQNQQIHTHSLWISKVLHANCRCHAKPNPKNRCG